MLEDNDSILRRILGVEPFTVSPVVKELSPERTLIMAVLVDGIETITKWSFKKLSTSDRKVYNETIKWFDSDEDSGVFSFVGACEALGVEPSYLRRGVRAAKALKLKRHRTGQLGSRFIGSSKLPEYEGRKYGTNRA